MDGCNICGRKKSHFACAKILDKYEIEYFRCQNCGFITTEKPYWLDEAYSDAIADTDVGLVSRNLLYAQKLSAVIKICFPQARKLLDYGGGYGLFVRIMRDHGFDCVWYDKYCDNLFAKGHEHQEGNHYDLCTAIELMEHSSNPANEIERISACSTNIVFTTALVPRDNPPRPDTWWYYALETGQHISFYTKESLMLLAEAYGFFYTGAGDIHVFSKKSSLLRFMVAVRFPSIINHVLKRKSLLHEDYCNRCAAKCC